MINISLLHQELLRALLPVVGVSTDGRIDYGRELTQAEQTTAATVIAAHNPEAYDAQILAARQTILNTAQSAVGVQLTALTAAQVRALMACMLYAAGGVDAATLTVKPLSEWMR